MVFGLDKQSYYQTLNINKNFENYIICDVSITLMTSCVGDVVEKLCKRRIGCLHFFKFKIVFYTINFREIYGHCTSMIAS